MNIRIEAKLVVLSHFFWMLDHLLELFSEVLLAHFIILRDLGVNLLLETVVEDSKHEIEKQIQTHHKEDHKVQNSPVVDLPVRENDVWEVRRGEQHVDIEHCVWDRNEIAITILIVIIVEEHVAEQREKANV